MIFGDLVGLKLADISLTGEEKLRKNLTWETCPDRGSSPVRCVTGARATACSTVVDHLDHGCARVAHFVTAWLRNFSHYCRPLRQYDV